MADVTPALDAPELELMERIRSGARSAKQIWDRAYKAGDVAKNDNEPDAVLSVFSRARTEIEAELRAVVRQIVSLDTYTVAVLSSVYPQWAPDTAPNGGSYLKADVAKALLDVESRYSRCSLRLGDMQSVIDSFYRQAQLLDLIDDEELRLFALDRLMESLLRAEIVIPTGSGNASRTWNELADRLIALQDLPSDEEVQDLGDLSRPDWPKNVDIVLARSTKAVGAAPPRMWRPAAAVDSTPTQLEAAAAADAPRRVAAFRARLARWSALYPAYRAQLQPMKERLSEALGHWLVRSTPQADGESDEGPWRQFRRWNQHVKRAHSLGAAVWQREWFSEQVLIAVGYGCQTVSAPFARSGSIAHYVHLCLTAAECGCPPLKGHADTWYLDEAQQWLGKLDPVLSASLKNRIAELTDASSGQDSPSREERVAWLNGDSRSDDGSARDFLQEGLQSTSALVRWLCGRALRFVDGKPNAIPNWSWGTIELDAEELAQLASDHRMRARWLADLDSPIWSATPDSAVSFLDELGSAVRYLSGRGDSAITIAQAQLLLEARQYEAAKRRTRQAAETDSRPKNLAICRELLALIEQRENPNGGEARLTYYRNLEAAYEIGRGARYRQAEALSPIVKAAWLAMESGWSWEAAECIRRIRHSGLDSREAETRRRRVENIARWFARRPTRSDRSRALLAMLLKQEAANLSALQATFVEDGDELEHTRRVVALLGALVPESPLIASLVQETPSERLHALAVALQRHGRVAVTDAVVDAAVQCMARTDKSATFVTAWLVRSYFDESEFVDRVTERFSVIRRYRYGERALQNVRAELPRALVEETARRCADVVSNLRGQRLGDPDLQYQIRQLNTLMDQGIVERLQPSAYRRRGALLLDDESLQRAFQFATIVTVAAPPSGYWAEASDTIRLLTILRECLDAKTIRRRGALAPFVQSFTLDVQLEASGLLTLNGSMRTKISVDASVRDRSIRLWQRSIQTLRARLSHELVGVSGDVNVSVARARRDPNLVNVSISTTVPAPLWARGPAADGQQIARRLDQLLGVQLGRLSGAAAGDVLGDITPILHRTKSDLEAISKTPGNRRLPALATISHGAQSLWHAISFPPRESARTPHLHGILEAELRAKSLTARLPAEIQPIVVAMPEQHVRLIVDAVLDNARKVRGAAEQRPVVQVTAHTSRQALHLNVHCPYNAAYPKGAGRGIEGIEGYLRYWGGRLSQHREGSRWAVRLQLPLATQEIMAGWT